MRDGVFKETMGGTVLYQESPVTDPLRDTSRNPEQGRFGSEPFETTLRLPQPVLEVSKSHTPLSQRIRPRRKRERGSPLDYVERRCLGRSTEERSRSR